MADYPKVILKKNKVQVMVDYCLDEAIEFTVRQQTFPDTDFEVEMKISDIKSALQAGMFLRENRFEVEGMESSSNKSKKTSKKSSKSGSDEEEDNDEDNNFQEAEKNDVTASIDTVAEVTEEIENEAVLAGEDEEEQTQPGLEF